jgi:hypothetical protein
MSEEIVTLYWALISVTPFLLAADCRDNKLLEYAIFGINLESLSWAIKSRIPEYMRATHLLQATAHSLQRSIPRHIA